jgi:hypothetical protein
VDGGLYAARALADACLACSYQARVLFGSRLGKDREVVPLEGE